MINAILIDRDAGVVHTFEMDDDTYDIIRFEGRLYTVLEVAHANIIFRETTVRDIE